jgi:hypothetical protein
METPSTVKNPVARFWSIAGTAEPPDLDQGPRPGVRPAAEIRDGISLLASDFELSRSTTDLLLAAALLFNDHHDEAHDLVQDLVDRDGCLIHAILHRREPDYWNASYWFRRVSAHPLYRQATPVVIAAASEPVTKALVKRLTLSGTLDPIAIVTECENVAPSGKTSIEARFLRQVQQAEFEALVAHLLA